MRVAGAVVGLGIAASLAACGQPVGVTHQAASPLPSTTLAPTTTTLAEPDGDGAEVLRRIAPSIAFVQTPYASGTAEVVEGGYLVTNAHVVDPFGAVDVQLPSRPLDEDVPVVGVDLMDDIAVLGPLEDPPPALPIVDGDDYPVGGLVFLVGYPAARASDLDLTITQGLLSRRQHIEGLDLTMLQTDATIVGGQSGGALVDEDGRFIGVSGIGTEGFALALDGATVRDSVRRILDGRGAQYRPLDFDTSATSFAATTGGELDELRIVLPPPTEDTTVSITATAADGTPLAVTMTSATGFTTSSDEPDSAGGPITQVGDGTWEVQLWAHEQAVLGVRSTDGSAVEVAVETSIAGVPYLDDEPTVPLQLGTPIEAVLESAESTDSFDVDLRAGEPVEVGARSLLGDLVIDITAVDGDDSASIDDGATDVAGWSGLDPVMTFTPQLTGTYRITLSRAWNDLSTVGYEIWVS